MRDPRPGGGLPEPDESADGDPGALSARRTGDATFSVSAQLMWLHSVFWVQPVNVNGIVYVWIPRFNQSDFYVSLVDFDRLSRRGR